MAAVMMPVAAGTRPTTVRWRIFVLMLTLVAVNYVDRASLSVAMPSIAREFELSPTVQGALLSSFFLTYALMQIPGGLLADSKTQARLGAAGYDRVQTQFTLDGMVEGITTVYRDLLQRRRA